MQMNSLLGPPIETYSANKAYMALTAIMGALFAGAAFYAEVEFFYRVLALGLAALMGVFLWLQLSTRVSLHPEGVSLAAPFRSGEMRWEEVEKFFYSATKQSVNFIPVGTYYRFKLIDAQGRKLSFGDAFGRAEALGQRLIEATYGPLMTRAVELYNSGAELDFGPLRLNRQSGFKVKTWRGWKEIPLDQIADYRIQQGHFYLWRVGEKRTTGQPLGEVPNAFVLLGLLDSIYQRAN